MKQRGAKKHWGRRGFGILFSLLLAVLFVAAKETTLRAKAQELAPSSGISVSTAQETDISAEQIFGALESGGLSSNGNLGIEPKSFSSADADAQPVSETGQPAVQDSGSADPGPLNSDTFEYLEAQGGLVAGASDSKVDTSQPTVFTLAADFLDKVVFKNYAEFFKKVTFDDGFEVAGQPIFNQDTAGFAVIKKENKSVKVDFDKKYKATPVVTASLSVQQYDDPEVRAAAEDLLLISDVKYVVTNATAGGFEIIMDRKADSDIPFSWHALAVRDPKIFKKDAKNKGPDGPAGGNNGLSTSGNSRLDSVFSGVPEQGSDPSSSPSSSGSGSQSPQSGSGSSEENAPAGMPGNNPSY